MTFQYGRELGKDFTLKDLDGEYSAVFISPGLWSGRMLEYLQSKNNNVTDAITFLKSARDSKQINTCNNVVVIGGGSVAADAAITAKKLGASNVTLICLERREEMPCLPGEILEMESEGIKIENSRGPQKIASKNRLSFDYCVSVFDDKNNFNPCFDNKNRMEFEFDQLIVAIGQKIESPLASYLEKEFGIKGLILVEKESMQVKGRPGVFAGGDIIRGAGTVVEAVADGRKAAAAIDKYIKTKFNSNVFSTSESRVKINNR
jgi:NADPH-dependent glutamate synthase beta subunit-like oxidoreductase